MFQGVYTAIVTPFKDGKLDDEALDTLVQAQVKAGVDGIVPVGTTGESATVDYEEHVRILALATRFAAGRIKVMAGSGGNSTSEAIYLTKNAAKMKADATLQVAPYYNKPTQEGLYQHFRAVAKATKLPIILYNIPSRCGVEIEIETIKRLAADCKTIVGIKEADGDPARVTKIRAAAGAGFTVLCGDDSLTLPFMALGAKGVVSVASNIIPKEIVRLVRAIAKGDLKTALEIHEQFTPLFTDLFLETNPGPVKAALAMMGLARNEFRLPLVPVSSENEARLRGTLQACGVLK